MTLYLSRLTLRRDPGPNALARLIDPEDRARAMDAHHRLIWMLFADTPDRTRDFLWRTDGKGQFFTLSHRKPVDNDLFEPLEVKEYAPNLSAGDRLSFVLRANATKALPKKYMPDSKDRRVDVIMAALKQMEKSDRAEHRHRIASEEGEAWLQRQGSNAGFDLREFVLEDYSTMALPRPHKGPRHREPKFGVLDMKGVIEVTEPEAFLAKLATGLGRAKAFGCGLMLIRRA